MKANMREHLRFGRPRSARIVLAIAYLLFAANCVFAQTSIFGEEVIGKWREFEVFSRNLQGTAHRHVTISSGKQRRYVDLFRQNRDCAYIGDLEEPNNPSFETFYITNARYAAKIKRNKAHPSDVVLLEYTEDRKSRLYQINDLGMLQNVSHHFCCCLNPLTELVSKPEFTAKIVGKESRDGRELVHVDFDFFSLDKKTSRKTTRHGSAYFDPSRYWSIYHIKETVQSIRGGKMERESFFDNLYETRDHSSGFPILKRLTSEMTLFIPGESGPGQKSNSTTTVDFELEINDRVPDEEFTLSAFGLPEPGISKKKLPIHIWILVGAVGCGLLALVFRYLARRRNRSTPAS